MTSGSSSGEAAAAASAKIVLSGVSKAFERRNSGTPTMALQHLDMSVPEGHFVSILGPSGCGKTTVLRLVDGLVPPDSGSVLVAGQAPRPGPEMGFVFQAFRLIPWATVQANVEFALTATGLNKHERAERAAHYIALVGLQRFAQSYPGELSGGMKQRVALARAFASEPSILLMDEPFASIDAQTRELMQVELMKLWAQHRATVLFVTHSVDEAIMLADRVVLMSPRPGRVIEEIEVGLPHPRWQYDIRATPRFIELRSYLWSAIRDLVLNDPSSDFYAPTSGAASTPAD
ncbi:MAG: transporter ATP-binding protein [Devosia sp.]|uniref:ABC transporter ATP-binding protein n=1 Tax=Devosia sp. TaxID=1871048 RepID=UPI002609E9C5|nr:ABC transporter ATP-binding protein [Devosia sp.]MDB5527950.1 transporter ATP-binding protein [Devosia sp.]